jgi:hypothetical protein
MTGNCLFRYTPCTQLLEKALHALPSHPNPEFVILLTVELALPWGFQLLEQNGTCSNFCTEDSTQMLPVKENILSHNGRHSQIFCGYLEMNLGIAWHAECHGLCSMSWLQQHVMA